MLDNETVYWAEFYNEGFFGFSETTDFKIGSLAHVIPIILTLLVIFLIYKYRTYFRNNNKVDNNVMTILTIIMIFAELTYWWRLAYVGTSAKTVHNMFGLLPIQVCQWTLLITVCAMISKSEKLIGTAFFLTSIPSVIAIAIPTVLARTGPSYYRYYQFWLEHLVPIISVYYMIFVHEYKINFKHILYSQLILSLLFIAGSKANVLLGENSSVKYLYMQYMRKIPFLTNTNDFELFIVCFIAFFIAFYIIYRIYNLIEKKNNEKNTMD